MAGELIVIYGLPSSGNHAIKIVLESLGYINYIKHKDIIKNGKMCCITHPMWETVDFKILVNRFKENDYNIKVIVPIRNFHSLASSGLIKQMQYYMSRAKVLNIINEYTDDIKKATKIIYEVIDKLLKKSIKDISEMDLEYIFYPILVLFKNPKKGVSILESFTGLKDKNEAYKTIYDADAKWEI